MAKRLVVLVLLVIMLGVTSCIYADEANWICQFRVDNGAGMYSGGTLSVGTNSSALDGDVQPDVKDNKHTGGQTNSIILASFTAGVGNGYGYSTDRQAPISIGTTKVWSLKLWLRDDCPATNIRLTGWNATGTTGDIVDPMYAKISVVSDVTKAYIFHGSTCGTSASPAFTWMITDAQQYKGIENALTLTFEAGVIPEPGSIVVMFTGLVGLGGYAIRRRR